MNKKGFAPVLILILVVIVLCTGVAVWYFLRNSPDYTLNNSEVSTLTSFLKENNLQAIAIEKLYQSNGASIWIVKSDGQEVFLYKKDLGTDGWGRPNYLALIDDSGAPGLSLFPDQAELADNDPSTGVNNYPDNRNRQIIDISKYITGHAADPFWQTVKNGIGEVSPGGKYVINLKDAIVATGPHEASGYEFLQLNKVVRQDGAISSTPMSLLPGANYVWSQDGNYILLQTQRYSTLGIYDINDATTTFSIDDHGYIQMTSGTKVATGTLALDVSGNVVIQKGGGSIPIPWGLLDATSSDILFPTTQIPSLPKDIKVIGLID